MNWHWFLDSVQFSAVVCFVLTYEYFESQNDRV
jgi:hypothetical protein